MKIRDLFSEQGLNETIARIDKLKPETQGQWGKMSVDQMLAHCVVTYDMVYASKYEKPKGLKKFIVKLLAKNAVVGPKPYPKNGRTAPDFIVENKRNFEEEKIKLTNYLIKTQQLGPKHFDQKESHSFGKLSVQEWNTLFSKHLDHHLTQFGV